MFDLLEKVPAVLAVWGRILLRAVRKVQQLWPCEGTAEKVRYAMQEGKHGKDYLPMRPLRRCGMEPDVAGTEAIKGRGSMPGMPDVGELSNREADEEEDGRLTGEIDESIAKWIEFAEERFAYWKWAADSTNDPDEKFHCYGRLALADELLKALQKFSKAREGAKHAAR